MQPIGDSNDIFSGVRLNAGQNVSDTVNNEEITLKTPSKEASVLMKFNLVNKVEKPIILLQIF